MKRLIIPGLAVIVAALALMMGTEGTARAATVNVDVDDNFYAPATITINVGDTVQWNFIGELPHTVSASDASFDSGGPQTAGTFSFTFNTAGTFNYLCGVHGQAMSGSVVVQQQEQPTNTPVAPSATPEPDDTAAPVNTPAPGSATVAPNTPPAGTPGAGTPVVQTVAPGAPTTPAGGAGGLPSAGTGGGSEGSTLYVVLLIAGVALAAIGGGALVRRRR
jgi:plastocyanin